MVTKTTLTRIRVIDKNKLLRIARKKKTTSQEILRRLLKNAR